jgi:TPR repeat protein
MQEAAKRQDPDGLYGMGVIHRAAGDFAKAAEAFQRAADAGHAGAMVALAQAHYRGEGVSRDETKAGALVMQAAEKGSAEAQFQLGEYYAQGAAGLDQSDKLAAEWYEHSADRNHLPAMRALAEVILRRPGVKRREIERAWNYIERGAHLGDVDCMLRLAGRIDRGEDPDMRGMDKAALEYQALHWYQRAADAGNADAQYTAALRMLHVRHERERGIQYLKSAAEQEHAESKKLLEDLKPEPEPEFQVPEVTALLSAAMAGDAASQYSLSVWHYNGYQVAQSFSLCYFWAKVMAKVSPGQAAELLQMVSPELKAPTRKKLDRHAEEWKPGLPPPAV